MKYLKKHLKPKNLNFYIFCYQVQLLIAEEKYNNIPQ